MAHGPEKLPRIALPADLYLCGDLRVEALPFPATAGFYVLPDRPGIGAGSISRLCSASVSASIAYLQYALEALLKSLP